MSRPNRNGILRCEDCGDATHVTNAKHGRCFECHEALLADIAARVEDLDDGDSYEAAEERLNAARLAGAA